MRRILYGLIVVFLLSPVEGFSYIRLPAVVGNNMVLQQQTEVLLWGWANPQEKIFVTPSWSDHTDSAITTNGAKWELRIKTPAAGGPFTIVLRGSNEITLKNIMIGEVWVCSGQSNMEWSSVNGVQDMEADLPASSNSAIRFFHIPRITSEFPQDDCKANWQMCTPATLKTFSAVAYYFAKKLYDSLHVPIGLINASWGGTPAETWTPAERINKEMTLKNAAATIPPSVWWPNQPGATYNAMIYPVTKLAIAGAIWYQGEANVAGHATYKQLLTTLIDSWRKAWNKNLPFYYVQIAPFTYDHNNFAPLLREQQTAAMSLPNTGMVVISDLVDNINDIHPRNKKDVGYRLASWALAETYQHNGSAYKSPVFKSMVLRNGKAQIYFDNAPNGFVIKGDTAAEWYIAGKDRHFVPAKVEIKKDRVIVFNKKVKEPVAVRFAFSNAAVGNIFSKEGLPVCPFRTDNW